MLRRLLRAAVANVWPVYLNVQRLPLFRWMSPVEAGRVWRRGTSEARRDWQWRTLLAMDVASLGGAASALVVVLRVIVRVVRGALRGQPAPSHLPLGCDLLLCLVPVGVLVSAVCGQTRVRLVYRYVLRQHPRLCRRCGYDLTATPDCCPECGGRPVRAD